MKDTLNVQLEGKEENPDMNESNKGHGEQIFKRRSLTGRLGSMTKFWLLAGMAHEGLY